MKSVLLKNIKSPSFIHEVELFLSQPGYGALSSFADRESKLQCFVYERQEKRKTNFLSLLHIALFKTATQDVKQFLINYHTI